MCSPFSYGRGPEGGRREKVERETEPERRSLRQEDARRPETAVGLSIPGWEGVSDGVMHDEEE